MKLKLKKSKKHSQWDAGYYRGKGGVSSGIVCYTGTFFFCLRKMLQPKNWKYWFGITRFKVRKDYFVLTTERHEYIIHTKQWRIIKYSSVNG